MIVRECMRSRYIIKRSGKKYIEAIKNTIKKRYIMYMKIDKNANDTSKIIR